MNGRRLALIVAVDTYDDPALRHLASPAADAEALAETLGDVDVGNFGVEIVSNRPSNVTSERVERLLSGGRPNDLLLLHFSCHGLKDDAGELYLAATNTRPDLLASTAVNSGWVHRLMLRSPARRVVLLLDCCYGGAFERGVIPRATENVDIGDRFRSNDLPDGHGRVVVTASTATQYAFEGAELTADARPSPSVFTGALVTGIRTGDADVNGDGLISLAELYDYVYERVARNSKQTPTKWEFGVRGTLFIARTPRGPTVIPDFDAAERARSVGSGTHVVDPYGRADFATITEAIGTANPGDRILVRPGQYRESLVIDKPLELIGDGPAEDVVVEGKGADTLLFRAAVGRVANVTLRQVGGKGTWAAVDVTQGRLELEDCRISSRSWSCVYIHDGADPRLRRNRIFGGKAHGVFVADRGLGTIEDNEIFDIAGDGVSIASRGNPTLRRNRIHHNRESGVYIFDRGRGVLEDNEIASNEDDGVTVEKGNPTLRNNVIRDNRPNGVIIFGNGRGTFEGNDIVGNAESGVFITGGNPTLHLNRVHHNLGTGVLVANHSTGVIDNNGIYANQSGGVAITTDANPSVRHNRINRNGVAGVHIRNAGRGVVMNNDLAGNPEPWIVEESCVPYVRFSGNVT